ncbi:MAG TPA: hypothetical protein VII94_05835, partial [Candidatus Saccharimonadales bacterium]
MSDKELRECPFCGKEPITYEIGNEFKIEMVMCKNYRCVIWNKGLDLMEWNQRPPANNAVENALVPLSVDELKKLYFRDNRVLGYKQIEFIEAICEVFGQSQPNALVKLDKRKLLEFLTSEECRKLKEKKPENFNNSNFDALASDNVEDLEKFSQPQPKERKVSLEEISKLKGMG